MLSLFVVAAFGMFAVRGLFKAANKIEKTLGIRETAVKYEIVGHKKARSEESRLNKVRTTFDMVLKMGYRDLLYWLLNISAMFFVACAVLASRNYWELSVGFVAISYACIGMSMAISHSKREEERERRLNNYFIELNRRIDKLDEKIEKILEQSKKK
jgi:hypothetical protein